ncbi:MAG TPA: hypothetical protein VF060_19205 [Trebonia sp.]
MKAVHATGRASLYLLDRGAGTVATICSVIGRPTRPQEVTDLVQLLARDRAGNMNSADLVVGGRLVTDS